MSKEKRFSFGRVNDAGGASLGGCFVSGVCLFAMTAFSLFLLLPLADRSELFRGILNQTAPVVWVSGWCFAVGLGGYYAARQGKTTSWRHSLLVGLLAECYLVVPRLVETPLVKMVDEAILDWLQLTFLALTIPAALVGGIIWEKTRKPDEAAGNEQSEPVSEAEPREE